MKCFQTQEVGRNVMSFIWRKQAQGFEIVEHSRIQVFPNRYRVVFAK
jgi:hypothetical protein